MFKEDTVICFGKRSTQVLKKQNAQAKAVVSVVLSDRKTQGLNWKNQFKRTFNVAVDFVPHEGPEVRGPFHSTYWKYFIQIWHPNPSGLIVSVTVTFFIFKQLAFFQALENWCLC